MMTCAGCGRQFSERDADAGCQGCGAHGGCHLIKCPYCHYEQAAMPRWVAKLKDLMTGKKGNFTPLYQNRPAPDRSGDPGRTCDSVGRPVASSGPVASGEPGELATRSGDRSHPEHPERSHPEHPEPEIPE